MNRRQVTAVRLVAAAYFAALFTATHWPRLDVARTVGTTNDALIFGVDKWGHVGAFGLLAFLMCMCRWGAGRLKRPALVTLAGVFVYATLDEASQVFVDGRSANLADFVANTIGILLGGGAFVALRWLSGAPLDGSPSPEGFAVHTRLVSVLTLVSRAFGLVRDWALWRALGFGAVYDAFVVAFMIPNLFRRLFGEGALAASFIPHYTRLDGASRPTARRFAHLILVRLTIVLLALVVVAALVITIVSVGLAPGSRGMLAAQLSSVTIWYMPLVCVAALLGAILQVHRRFAVPAASPVVLNVLIIAAALGGAVFLRTWTAEQRVFLIAGALVLSGIIQVVWHALAIADDSGGWTPLRRQRGESAMQIDHAATAEANRGLLAQWAPTVVGLAVFQVNVLADSLIAMVFSGPGDATIGWLGGGVGYPMDIGAVAVLGSSARLYEFPLGVFGIALATAIFPQLAALAAERGGFSKLLRRGLRLAMFIGLPASVGLLLVRYPLARAIYFPDDPLGSVPGASDDAARIAWVLAGYAPAVWAYSMNHVLTRAFYAHHDAVTPMRVAVGMVALNVTLNLVLIWPLGAAGLAWSTAICATLQTVVLLVLIRRYADAPVDAGVAGCWGRTALLSGVMALAVWAVLMPFDMAGLGRLAIIGLLAGATAAGALVFLAGARLLRMPEIAWLLDREAKR